MKTATIMRQINKKSAILNKIALSEEPTNPVFRNNHVRRVLNAELFLEELNYLPKFIDLGLPIRLVNKNRFDREISEADFVSGEYFGQFCKVAIVESYLQPEKMLVYIAPISAV